MGVRHYRYNRDKPTKSVGAMMFVKSQLESGKTYKEMIAIIEEETVKQSLWMNNLIKSKAAKSIGMTIERFDRCIKEYELER